MDRSLKNHFMKFSKSNLSLLFLLLFSLVFTGCYMEAPHSGSASFSGDQKMVVKKIQDLTHAEKVSYKMKKGTGFLKNLIPTELRIDIFNPADSSENLDEIVNEIMVLTKKELEDPGQYPNFTVNFIWEDKNGNTKKTTKTVEFKPEDLNKLD